MGVHLMCASPRTRGTPRTTGRGAVPRVSVRIGQLPRHPTRWIISGITYASDGVTPLGSCIVSLYRTNPNPLADHSAAADRNDMLLERVTSDATTGAYSFSAVGLDSMYYVVAYKDGSPDVFGTTVHTLVGVAG